MKLSEMKVNARGRVKDLKGEPRFLNRINSVGLNEGADFQVVRNRSETAD